MPDNIHKIDENQYQTLRAMMEDLDSIELAIEILRNADREDDETNYYLNCLGNMYWQNSIFYNKNAKTIWQAQNKRK